MENIKIPFAAYRKQAGSFFCKTTRQKVKIKEFDNEFNK